MEPLPSVHIVYGLSPIFPLEIYFYDLKSSMCKCKILPIAKKYKGKFYEPRIPASCAMAGNTCLVSGGGHPEVPDFFNSAVTCRIVPVGDWTFHIQTVQSMIMEKAEHALCAVSSDLIISVGGATPKNVISYCEAYSLSKDTWMQFNPLSLPRKQVSLCVFNNEFLYAFGGKNQKELPLTSLERLKLGDQKNSWRKLLLASDKGLYPFSSALMCQISEDTILIGGGTSFLLDPKVEKPVAGALVELQETNKSLYFSVKSLKFSPGPNLALPAAFSIGPPAYLNGKVGAIDIQMNIHLFDVSKNLFEYKKEMYWNTFKFKIKAESELL